MRYLYGPYVIDSDIRLPLSAATSNDAPKLTLRARTEPQKLEAVHWFHRFQFPDGRVHFALGKQSPEIYVINFPDAAVYWIHSHQGLIKWAEYRDIAIQTRYHLLLDQVIPRSLSAMGDTVLHASAVSVGKEALVFIGDSGAGKSTLSAHLGRTQSPLLSDDCLVIQEDSERVSAIASYPGLRLWPDSLGMMNVDENSLDMSSGYSRKRRLAVGSDVIEFYEQSIPIKSVFVLRNRHKDSDAQAVSIELVKAQEKVVNLIEHSFRLDITDRDHTVREFETLARLAGKLPMYWLSYPRRYDMLPAVQEAIMSHIRKTS